MALPVYVYIYKRPKIGSGRLAATTTVRRLFGREKSKKQKRAHRCMIAVYQALSVVYQALSVAPNKSQKQECCLIPIQYIFVYLVYIYTGVYIMPLEWSLLYQFGRHSTVCCLIAIEKKNDFYFWTSLAKKKKRRTPLTLFCTTTAAAAAACARARVRDYFCPGALPGRQSFCARSRRTDTRSSSSSSPSATT